MSQLASAPPLPPPVLVSDATSSSAYGDARYASPRLTTYGSARTLTATVGSKGKFDNTRRTRRTGF